MPDRTQVICINIFGFGQVVITLVATSQEVISDLVSGARPTSKGGTAKEFGVVGMGQNDKYILGGRPCAGGESVRSHK